MEVGAVKQAFNNELILLKKKLNQAKIQIIHKLTRKAKTFADKKAPEPLKEKLKRKAESAVNEVLIIKKINPKDLARFAVTHKGQLNDYLNKPNVDLDKACARLLLHKSLQDKYKLIRTQFSSIPIEDLLMSREERRKLKKEEKEKLKNKRKEKELKRKQKEEKGKKIVNTEGVWDVEDVNVSDSLKEQNVSVQSDLDEDLEDEEKASQNGNNALEESSEDLSDNESDKELSKSQDGNEASESDDEMNNEEKTDDEMDDEEKTDDEVVNEEKSSEDEIKVSNTNSSIKTNKSITKQNTVAKTNGAKNIAINNPRVEQKPAPKPPKTKTKENKQNKNKNLNEKLLTRKFKKDVLEAPIPETKIVDPFFITSTGENYMSVVEPRPPDEIKEVHKQGNRKLRRAAMFGHMPKIKPRQNNFAGDDNRSNRNSGFNKNNNSTRFGDRDNSDDKRNFTNKRFKFDRNEETESKPEKLHPSWEAKKKQSGILPFQGKKIVFDES